MWKTLVPLVCFSISSGLSAQTKVLVFAGSSRADSLNKKLAIEAAHAAQEMGAEVIYIDLKDYPIPFYDGDLEKTQGMPENAKQVRRLMVSSDVIMIASPEYNSSVSALLKNMIDWTSRKEEGGSSREAFKGKKILLMSASPGSGGGARGLVHLQAIIEDIGGTVIPEKIVVPAAHNAFDEEGKLKSQAMQTELHNVIKPLIKQPSAVSTQGSP